MSGRSFPCKRCISSDPYLGVTMRHKAWGLQTGLPNEVLQLLACHDCLGAAGLFQEHGP